MRFFVEATEDGYKFGIESKKSEGNYNDFVTYHEVGGHGDVEKMYADAEQLFNELRTRELQQ